MVRPIASTIGVSFAYGVRYKSGVIHKGVDFSDGKEGHTVSSCLGGTVTHAGYGGWGPAYGQHVIIKSTFNGKPKWVLYGHLKTENVSVGQKIKAGQKIGTSGGRAGQRYSGNSTGPHLHVQVGHANNYLSYEDPWAVINSGAAVPPKPLTPWFSGLCWNWAGYDTVRGAATFDKRLPGLVKAVEHFDRDVLHLLEVPGQKIDAVTERLAKLHYKHVVDTDGRTLFVRDDIRIGKTRTVTLATKGPANDDKQIVMAEAFIRSDNAVVLETGHLEYRDGARYNPTRVAQGRETKNATLSFAKSVNVPNSRIVFYNDENSASQVSDQAFGKTWNDLGDRDGYTGGGTSTLIGWNGKPLKNDYRPDKVHVHKDRPARGGTSDTFAGDELSDHLPIIYTVGKTS